MNDLWDQVHIVGKAAGEDNRTISFTMRGPQAEMSSGTVPDDVEAESKAEMITIDSFAKSNPPPQIIKIDVEGHEMNVLLGAAETIQKYRPVLLMELHPSLIGRFSSNLRELLDWLLKRGYVGFDGRDIRINNAKVARSGWIQRLYFLPLNPSVNCGGH